MKQYYQKPSIIRGNKHDHTFAFTMRMLNFLSKLGLKHWKYLNEYHVDWYAKCYSPDED